MSKKKRSAPKKTEEAKDIRALSEENAVAEEETVNEETTVNEAAAVSEENVGSEKNSEKKTPDKPRKRRFNPRALKHGALSAVLTIVFIAAVVVINVIVGIVSERVNTAADLTDSGLYTLDEKSEDYIRNRLGSDVSVTVLNSEKTFEEQQNTKQVSEILKKMSMLGDHVRINYLNLDQNPNYTSKFKGETLAADYIVVESEKTGRHKIITPADYFGLESEQAMYYYYYYGMVQGYYIEQEAVSAMMYVSNDDPVRIAFTEGFGESADSAALKNLLSKNGYEVETLNLITTEEIDPDIDFVVVYAPSMDIDNPQLAKLDKFLDNGGKFGKNVFYFASVTQPQTPNIESFLNDWGVSVGFSEIGQSDEQYLISSATYFAHIQQVCDTEYTKNSLSQSLYTYGADLRPVYVLNNSSNDREVLMKTYDKAFLYPLDLGADEEFDISGAENGEFNDAVVSTRVHSDGAKSRLCVFGSDQLSGSIFMPVSNANNPDFFINLFNSISGKEDGITIRSKALSNVTFEMNVKTANTLALILCVIIPVCVIVLGIVIWVRRRHR